MDDHLPDDRLAAMDPTPEEAAHLQGCARCRVAARRLAAFLEEVTNTWPPHDSPATAEEPVPTEEVVLEHRFTLLRPLGTGGTASVLLAHDRVLGRDIAWKALRPELQGRMDRRFLREARITAQLEHPNIVPIYDIVNRPNHTPGLVMRVVRGISISEALRSGRLVGVRERLDVLVKVCDAVAFAHSRGVVHRDLKPHNIMVGEFGEVQVMDFGLAARVMATQPAAPGGPLTGDAELTQAGTVLGTPCYMAPEQARGGTEKVGISSDIYALGATLWELLVGAPPFEGDVESVLRQVRSGRVRSPRQVVPSIPRDLEAVTLRAMAFDPADRYASVAALRADLVAFLGGHRVSAREPSLSERAWKWTVRNRQAVVPVATTGLLALLVLLGLLVAWARDAKQSQRAWEQEGRRAREMASAAEFARKEAQLATADVRLAQARRDLETHPALARSALLQAGSVGFASKERAAGLALDTMAGSTPMPVVTLATAGNVRQVEVVEPGDRVRVVTTEGRERLFLLPSGEELPPGDPALEGAPPQEPILPQDPMVIHVTDGGGDEVELRSPRDGSVVARLGLLDPRPNMAWSGPLRLLLVSYRDGVAAVPVAPSQDWISGWGRPGPAAVAISPDGTLVALGWGAQVHLLSRASHRELVRLPLDGGALRTVAFLDGHRLAVGTRGGILVHDLADGSSQGIPTRSPVQEMGTSPAGLAALLEDGSLLVRTRDGTTRTLPDTVGTGGGLHLDGDLLLVHGTGEDAVIRAFRWPSLDPLWTRQPEGSLLDVALRAETVALATAAGQVQVLDSQTGQLGWSVLATGGALEDVAISADGIVFATSPDRELTALRNGEHLWSWPVEPAVGSAIATHEDLVVLALRDGTLWWLERGLHERLSAEDSAAVGRRYLAAHLPLLAARALAPLPRQDLLLTERLLLVEEGLDEPASLVDLDLAPGSARAWASLLRAAPPASPTPAPQPGAGPR